MRDNRPAKLSLGKRIMYSLIEASGAIIGGLLLLLCCYWFFHYETWHERLIAIGLSIAVVYLIGKVLPERPNQKAPYGLKDPQKHHQYTMMMFQ